MFMVSVNISSDKCWLSKSTEQIDHRSGTKSAIRVSTDQELVPENATKFQISNQNQNSNSILLWCWSRSEFQRVSAKFQHHDFARKFDSIAKSPSFSKFQPASFSEFQLHNFLMFL
jgi:hypothetical protein